VSAGSEPANLAALFEAAKSSWKVVSVFETRPSGRGTNAWAALRSPKDEIVEAFVKQNLADEDCFHRELAATQLLNSVTTPTWIKAEFLFAIEEARLMVWKNLGDLTTLGEHFETSGPAAGHQALRDLGKSLAKLHASFPSHGPGCECVLCERAEFEAKTLVEGLPVIEQLLSYAWERPPTEAGNVVTDLANAHTSQNPNRSLTHGDQAPSNVAIVRGDVCLIDFEFAAFRPRLYDLATWNVLCPLPTESVSTLVRSYQVESRSQPSEFQIEWAQACAFRALAMLASFGSGIFEANGIWGRDWDKRSALIVAFDRAAAANKLPDGPTPAYDLMVLLASATRKLWSLNDLSWGSLGSVGC